MRCSHFKLAMLFTALAIIGLAIARGLAPGQSTTEHFRITEGVTRNQMNFHQVSVPAGSENVLADLTGPGKVTYFYITDDSVGKWYPGLVLKVFWDQAQDPSVCVPLADYFGAVGGRTVDYQSVVMQINHACFMCYLPMPFAKRARFVLANDGNRDYSRKVAHGVDYERSTAYATEKSRLYCEWRRSNPVVNGLHTIMTMALQPPLRMPMITSAWPSGIRKERIQLQCCPRSRSEPRAVSQPNHKHPLQ